MATIKTWQQRCPDISGLDFQARSYAMSDAKDEEIRELRAALLKNTAKQMVSVDRDVIDKVLKAITIASLRCVSESETCEVLGANSALREALSTAGQPSHPVSKAWECNECGAQEYSTMVSEEDVHKLGCSSCGSSEWHLATGK